MGLFDVNIEKKLESKSEQFITDLKDKFAPLSDEVLTEKNLLVFKNFKAQGTLLNYNLDINFTESKETISLNIFAELQNVWLLVILIVFAILFTYGLGVVLLVGFIYYQKVVVTKYIEKVISNT